LLVSTYSPSGRRLLAWSRVVVWVGIAWSVCWLISPLVFGLMGWSSSFGTIAPGVVLLALGGIYGLLRRRADPVYDGWPWNRAAEPPPDDTQHHGS